MWSFGSHYKIGLKFWLAQWKMLVNFALEIWNGKHLCASICEYNNQKDHHWAAEIS